MIRQDAAMPVSRFCALTGIPRRTYQRKLARMRQGEPPVKGPWPAPAVEVFEPVAAKYAAEVSEPPRPRSTVLPSSSLAIKP